MNAPTISPDLPPLGSCPFCGSTMHTKAGMNCWYAHCSSCQAEGPPRDTEAEAIAAANRRASRLSETISVRFDVLHAYAERHSLDYNELCRTVRDAIAEGSVAALAATGPTPPGYVLIGKDALQMLFNALERAATGSPTSGNSDEKDAQRLDWLEQNPGALSIVGGHWFKLSNGTHFRAKDFRAAIDAAMAASTTQTQEPSND